MVYLVLMLAVPLEELRPVVALGRGHQLLLSVEPLDRRPWLDLDARKRLGRVLEGEHEPDGGDLERGG
ncbi:MAG TPA: hypothetical protein VGH76_26795, partial [Actinomycetospora sp.]|uniref:hypothetical protein n=1 Tax=Actinomycetospora sp. TaxID=1872135 RepID=UPI002F3ECD05